VKHLLITIDECKINFFCLTFIFLVQYIFAFSFLPILLIDVIPILIPRRLFYIDR